MCYSQGHPIRLIGGRLVLDFVNTADWTADGHVAHEKLVALADVEAWQRAVGLDAHHGDNLANLIRYRHDLREMLRAGTKRSVLNAVQAFDLPDFFARSAMVDPRETPTQPLTALLAASAISLLYEPNEFRRIKMCPGECCGWLFLDETKNSRRTWCCMETCGNRAKAARHYARRKAGNLS